MVRAVVLSLTVAALLAGCSQDRPALCGATDDARVAVGNASANQYATVLGQHVAEVRRAADSLSGDQGTLAQKIADELEAASKASSTDFTDKYNQFLADSNRFDQLYCNAANAPD